MEISPAGPLNLYNYISSNRLHFEKLAMNEAR